MSYDSIIFDLDGTLWDTCNSCAIAWNTILERNNIQFRPIVAHDVREVCGLPHAQCIEDTFAGLSKREIQILIEETMTEDNVAVEDHGGYIYDGVKEGLAILSEKHPLFIVSNCQDGYIETFLKYSGLSKLFKDYESWGRSGNSKHENILDIMRRNDLKETVYIGDTMGDYSAAVKAEVPFLHVTYGFGAVKNALALPSFPLLVDHILNRNPFLRPAKASECEYLSELALRSKSIWNYSEKFIEGCRPHIRINLDYVQNWPVTVLEEDGQIKGFYSLKKINGENRLDNLWIEPEYIKNGHGKTLFLDAVEKAKVIGWSHFRLAGERNAIGFYEKMGASLIGQIQSRLRDDLFLPHMEYRFN